MKFTKILRVLSLAAVLSLLVLAFPASAQTRFITLYPEEGSIGSEIDLAGEGFNASTVDTDRYANIYFSSDEASTVHDIDDEVTRYKILREGQWLDEEGEFVTSFDVPDVLDDGDDTEDVSVGTYYVYVTHYPVARIRAVAEFTVIGGQTTIDPDTGPVGTEAEITGADFSSNNNITVEYDGTEVDIESGDDETDGSGEFDSFILIPESTAGDHTISVTVSGNEVTVSFTVEPEIVLSPTSGEADTEVSVSGTGFGRREDLIVYFGNNALVTATADTRGTFASSFSVPELDAGIYNVEAEDDDSNVDRAKFTITVPPPPTPAPGPTPQPQPQPPGPGTEPSSATIKLSPTTGKPGTTVVLTGAGFEVDSQITIAYEGEAVFTADADKNGLFVAIFKIPASTTGEHALTVTDGTSTEEVAFTVASRPPPPPSPLLPEMGVEVEPPVTFDWADVIADSPPVTYRLQVSSGGDFSADNLVLEKEALTKSEYTVTEEEAAEMGGQEAPYYWRVKTMDSAANEGEWTGPGQFFITPSFSMPSWVIYTLLGIGGLGLFVIGYMLGRRTAYYY